MLAVNPTGIGKPSPDFHDVCSQPRLFELLYEIIRRFGSHRQKSLAQARFRQDAGQKSEHNHDYFLAGIFRKDPALNPDPADAIFRLED